MNDNNAALTGITTGISALLNIHTFRDCNVVFCITDLAFPVFEIPAIFRV